MRNGRIRVAWCISCGFCLTIALIAVGCFDVCWGQTTANASGGETAINQAADLGGGVHLDMVLIPAGDFSMGSPDDEKDRGES